MTGPVSDERIRAWIEGRLPDADAEALERSMEDDADLESRVSGLLAAIPDGDGGTSAPGAERPDPLRSSAEDAEGPAAQARQAVLEGLRREWSAERGRERAACRAEDERATAGGETFAFRPPAALGEQAGERGGSRAAEERGWRPWAGLGVGLALAAGLALALVWRPAGPGAAGLESTTRALCALWVGGGATTAFQPAAGCGVAREGLLGAGVGDGVRALRERLDAAPRRGDPAWLRARVLAAFLEGDAAAVVALLEGPDGQAAMGREPRLRGDLAVAHFQLGNIVRARNEIAVAIQAVPTDEGLRANAERMR